MFPVSNGSSSGGLYKQLTVFHIASYEESSGSTIRMILYSWWWTITFFETCRW